MRLSRLWSTIPVFLSMCFSFWSFLPAYAQQPPQRQGSDANQRGLGNRPEGSGPTCAAANNSMPSGLVVVITDKPQLPTLDLRVLRNPCISGVALQIHWADLESVQGKPDWSKLDQLFWAAESSHKWVQLLIFPGFFSPAWALEGGVKTESFAIQYGPGKGAVKTLPMPWDKVYLARWSAFLKLLSARYGKEPSLRVVAAVGPTSVSAEMSLPEKLENLKIWQSEGYTPHKYIEAWQQMFQAYAVDFPNQWVSLSVGIGLNINNQGRIERGEGARTRQMIIDLAMARMGSRFVLQNSDLSAGPVRHPATQFVIGYSGRIITGLQMRTSADHNSADMGAAGSPPLALRRSIDLGMEPNSAGQSIDYLEIYEPDVVADDLQPVLRYGASLFGPKPHAAAK